MAVSQSPKFQGQLRLSHPHSAEDPFAMAGRTQSGVAFVTRNSRLQTDLSIVERSKSSSLFDGYQRLQSLEAAQSLLKEERTSK
jgi:hypothetical protein